MDPPPMTVRLGNTRIGLFRYLGFWAVIVVVFAIQGAMKDALYGNPWTFLDGLRWSIIEWYT